METSNTIMMEVTDKITDITIMEDIVMMEVTDITMMEIGIIMGIVDLIMTGMEIK